MLSHFMDCSTLAHDKNVEDLKQFKTLANDDLLDLFLFTLAQSIGHWPSASIWFCSVSLACCTMCLYLVLVLFSPHLFLVGSFFLLVDGLMLHPSLFYSHQKVFFWISCVYKYDLFGFWFYDKVISMLYCRVPCKGNLYLRWLLCFLHKSLPDVFHSHWSFLLNVFPLCLHSRCYLSNACIKVCHHQNDFSLCSFVKDVLNLIIKLFFLICIIRLYMITVSVIRLFVTLNFASTSCSSIGSHSMSNLAAFLGNHDGYSSCAVLTFIFISWINDDLTNE